MKYYYKSKNYIKKRKRKKEEAISQKILIDI
jgi:hypothetical protein